MSKNLYINGSVVISDNNKVYKNNLLLFQHQQTESAIFLRSIYDYFDFKYPKYFKMDKLSKLGWLAAEILLIDEVSLANYRPHQIGVILSNKNASLDTDIKYFETTKMMASPSLFVYTLPNIVIGEICIRNNFKGENSFFISDFFNADFLEQYVNLIFNDKETEACICGWVDCFENKFRAVLFLIERQKENGSICFSANNLNKTNNIDNG